MDDFNNNGIYDSDEFARIYLSVFGDEVPCTGNKAAAAEEYTSSYSEEPKENSAVEYFEADYLGKQRESYTGVYQQEEYPEEELPEDASREREEFDFNPGFKLGSRSGGGYSYGGHVVNTGADVNYSYSQSPEYDELSSSYYPDSAEEEPEAAEELPDSGEKKGFKLKKPNFRNKKEKSEDTDFDGTLPEDELYPDFDEGASDDYSESAINKSDYVPSSFRQYVGAKITGVILRLRGGVPSENTNCTDEIDSDDLGTEVPFLAGSKFYGAQVHFLRLRFRVCLVLFLIQAYLSLNLPAPGMLQTLSVSTAAAMAIQLAIMLISLDAFTCGILNAFNGRLGADSLVSIVCILTTLDALMVIYSNVDAHMPLCIASSFSMVGLMFSNLLSARGLRKALRVPAISKKVYTVTGESGVTGSDSTILKSARPATGFVHRCEEAPPDEELYIKLAPFILIISLILALVVCAVRRNFSGLLFVYTAILSPAVPFGALLCFAYPYFTASMKLFQSGVAIAGWSGALDAGKSKNLIITDRDIFPEDCIEIENVRIFADYDSDKVISYAGTMIINSGCGLSPAFAKLMEESNLEMLNADNFEFLSGGGMKAMIEGHVIICGNSDLMRLMDIKIPFRLVSRTSVLLAIDGVLYGIFNINYMPDPKVRKALVSLMRSSRHPIFALRDFNITPEMIRDYFDVATDGYDFPPYVDRFAISEAKPAAESKIAAVICREGLSPLIAMAEGSRSVYLVSCINLAITLVLGLLGALLVFIKLIAGGTISAGFILLLMLLSAIPVVVLGILALQIN